MDKIYPYTIYHLDHKKLSTAGRNAENEESDSRDRDDARLYKDLMSNRPRHDMSISQCFGSRHRHGQENEMVKNNKMASDRLIRKIQSAALLMEHGFYIEVAKVDESTATNAVKLTRSVNSLWMDYPNKKVLPVGFPWRSTDSYDLIKRFDDFFLVMPLGYVDMKNERYADNIV